MPRTVGGLIKLDRSAVKFVKLDLIIQFIADGTII